MRIDNQNIDELLAKYFAGEAMPEEAMFIDDWKNSTEENLAHFARAQSILNINFRVVNKQKLFKKIINEANISTENKKPQKIVLASWYLKIAAVFIFISVGVLVYYKLSKPIAETILAANDQMQNHTLTDGTLVTLNKNASLTLIGAFNNKQRKLKLIGEAFFEVTHNEESPFIIEVGDLEIKDIGTAFNVKALPQNDTVFVVVTEGIVELKGKINTIQLHPNQSAFYLHSTGFLKQVNQVDVNMLSYKTKAFSFKSAFVKDVVASINAIYGNVIALEDNNLGNCLITVDFNNETPEVMAMIIAETLGLTYQKINEVFVISGQACQK